MLTDHRLDQKNNPLGREQFVPYVRLGLVDYVEVPSLNESCQQISAQISFSIAAEREGADHGEQKTGPESGQQIQDNRQAETSQPGGEEQQPHHSPGLM